jgi:transcriptional regulator NrdR family protein
MTDVIKLNGKKERFSEEKVKNSIESAIKDAGLNINAKKKLIDNTLNDVNELVGDKKEVTAEDIRRVIIDDFEQDWEGDQVPVARAWRNYELKHGIIYRE